MARIRLLIVLAVLASGGGAAYWYLNRDRDHPDGNVRISGNIEATEAQVAFKIAGGVVERLFDEGQKVGKDQPVAKLDTSDLECNVDLRRAEVKVAEAALAELKAGSRPQEIEASRAAVEKASHALRDLEAGARQQEINAAEAAVAGAEADRVRAESDFRRNVALYQRKAISAEDYDASRATLNVTQERHRQAVAQLRLLEEGSRKEQIAQGRSALAQAEAQYDLVKAGPRQEVIDQAKARLEQAQAALRFAEVQLSYAVVRSPLSGVVLSKNIEPGEYVAPGTPVVTVGDLVNVWLRGYIQESDKGRVKFGQTAWVTTDAYPGKKYKGRVSFIAQEAEFTPKSVQTQKERVKLVYRVKIDITNPDEELNPGMPADAVIETGQ